MRVKYSWLMVVGVLGASLSVAACGGSSKPAEEPASESAPAEAEKKEEKPSAEPAEKPAETAEKKEDSSEGPKITRTPKDILTAPDILFMFNFNSSEMGERAEKQCDEQAKDNPKKRAECMTRAKTKIEVDGMRFKQEKGRWYWSTIRRKGKTLVNINKVPIEFGKEDDHSIVLKPAGKDEGTSPGKGLSETTVEVPNEYQIVIQDSKQGRMVFDAKIGLTEN